MYYHRLRQRSRSIMLIAVAALFIITIPTQASVCTLADHIKAANTNTAVGFCPAGTSHDVITIAEDITLTEPLPPITGTITIEGGGHTISGDKKFPIFIVQGGRLTINNLTLTEGYDKASRWTAFTGAGGIQIYDGGYAAVSNSIFTENRSGEGHGGAISVNYSQLRVSNSSFLNNNSAAQGGAIFVWFSVATITNSSFVGNSVHSIHRGGAIYAGSQSKLSITNSTFHNNYAHEGGAVATEVWPGQATFTTLTHVTMIGNRATRGKSIFVDLEDANFKLRNSIVAGMVRGQCRGRLNENIGNLIADRGCPTAVDGDPKVAKITGSPAHFPLMDGSPALDAADPKFCPETDQIGTARPQAGGCDIGAIESATAIPAPTPVATLCILPDQIIAANTDSAYKACPAGNGADIIYMIRDYELSEPLPLITSEITIEGNGYTIRANSQFPIFDVDSGKLTIKDATLAEGQASKGGAIRLRNGATVTASGIRFVHNTAVRGGAIAIESANDRLTVRDSSFVGNHAETLGGAILVEGGRVDVRGSAFLNNRSTETGGAVAVTGGRATLSNSTLNGNEAARGGGVHIVGGEATLTHLTLMNNVAERLVGAGIFREAGAVYLRNSIIAGSGSGDDCSGRLDQSRGNFSQDATCSTLESGDPMLGDLTGSPAHHPLLDASPAHGTADASFCPATDQLGNQRAHCDIGAVESARVSDFAAVPKAGPPADCSLRDQIVAANTDEPAGGCPAGNGADTIMLTQDIALSEPLPPIIDDIIISGNGHTISGNIRSHIFDIESGAVVIKNMTLENGSNPTGEGGAITLRNSASLMVVNVSFRKNTARYGGAIASEGLSELNVFDSVFVDNVAEISGGAIWNNGACGTIDNNHFHRSRAGDPTGSHTLDRAHIAMHLDGPAPQCEYSMGNYYSDT